MGNILIDNWNLANANITKTYTREMPNESYTNLLSALVLWDDVYYLDDGFATFGWLNMPKGKMLSSVLKPLYLENTIKRNFENSSNDIYIKDFRYRYKKIIAERVIFYHEVSKAFDVDYYPIKERAEFLDQFLDNLELWNRNEILKSEEKEILKRIQEFNVGSESYIKFPLLTNLIVKNTGDDYIHTALNIKNTKEVKNFRKYMDKIDREINMGNFGEVRYILSLLPYIIDEIEDMDRKISISTTIKIKLTPMVLSTITGAILSNIYTENDLLSLGLICLSLKELFAESKIEINKETTYINYPKRIQLNFLRTLAKEYIKK